MTHEVLVAGETLVDFLPERVGPLSDVDRFTRRPGGAPANVAVGLAALSETPLFWTRVGDDPFGRFLTAVLASHGVPDRFVERDPDAKTAVAFVTHDEDADREFSFYRDGTADTRMQSGRVSDETLDSVSWVHAGGVTLADGASRQATLDLIDRASDHGCIVSFDPNARPELWASPEEYREVVTRALASVDVLKATAEELHDLGIGTDAEEPTAVARRVFDYGPHTVLSTRGADGAIAVATDDAPWTGEAEHPGYEVSVVDATGAGDAFLAAAVAALNGGERDLGEMLAFADAVAAISTSSEGAMAAVPDRDTVAAFRRERSQ